MARCLYVDPKMRERCKKDCRISGGIAHPYCKDHDSHGSIDGWGWCESSGCPGYKTWVVWNTNAAIHCAKHGGEDYLGGNHEAAEKLLFPTPVPELIVGKAPVRPHLCEHCGKPSTVDGKHAPALRCCYRCCKQFDKDRCAIVGCGNGSIGFICEEHMKKMAAYPSYEAYVTLPYDQLRLPHMPEKMPGTEAPAITFTEAKIGEINPLLTIKEGTDTNVLELRDKDGTLLWAVERPESYLFEWKPEKVKELLPKLPITVDRFCPCCGNSISLVHEDNNKRKVTCECGTRYTTFLRIFTRWQDKEQVDRYVVVWDEWPDQAS